jgi:FkbM family methyltransferase
MASLGAVRLARTSVSVAGRPPVSVCVDLDSNDEVAPWLLEHDWIDEPVQRAFLDHVAPHSRVLDLGSHLGVFSLPAAALGADVVAVDALPGHAELLRTAAGDNGFDHLRVMHGAVADGDGPVRIVEDSVHSHVAAEGSLDVPTVNLGALLDELGWDSLDVVKVDIEGSEPAALAGLGVLFERGVRPVLVFECNATMLSRYGSSPATLRSQIERLGYRLWQIDHLNRGRLVQSSSDRLQPEAVCDYLALPEGTAPSGEWDVRPPFGELEFVTRVCDQACDRHPDMRAYAADLIVDGPEWLTEHPLAVAARPALDVTAPRTGPDEGVAPEEDDIPDDLRVVALDLALHERTDIPDRPPGSEQPTTASGVSFHVRAGQVLAVTGDAGAAGLIPDVLADLVPLHAGELATSGRIASLTGIADGFEPGMTVAENIVIFSGYVGADATRMADAVRDVARVAGVTRSLDRPLSAAARGVAARIALTVALDYTGAELLLLEPLGPLGSERFETWLEDRLERFLEAGGAIVQTMTEADDLLVEPTRVLRVTPTIACGYPGALLGE